MSKKDHLGRLFFREIRNDNPEKAAEYLAEIIDAHLQRYPYHEDTLTVYITTHLILTLDLSGHLEFPEETPFEPLVQDCVHRFGNYLNEPDATLRLAQEIMQKVNSFNQLDPSRADEESSCLNMKDGTHGVLIRNICGYLGKNFRDPNVTVTTTAEYFGMSVSYISRVFHNATGMKMGDYILMLKFDEAKRLLRTTEISVAEVAERCGFSSCSAFIRSYRAKEGGTPGAYRRQLLFDDQGNPQKGHSESGSV